MVESRRKEWGSDMGTGEAADGDRALLGEGFRGGRGSTDPYPVENRGLHVFGGLLSI